MKVKPRPSIMRDRRWQTGAVTIALTLASAPVIASAAAVPGGARAEPAGLARHLAAAALPQAGGLQVFVGYAEDKEINTPDPAAFPVPWAGSPRTIFLGGTVPGQGACGTLTTCYDAGAIRLDNPGTTPVSVDGVSVDDHSSVTGGQLFGNLWGSFTVPPGQSAILTENPPGSNLTFDNFDTSSFPSTCTPLTVAPTVTITIGGVPTTLTDTAHVLDTGGIDAGTCSPKRNESEQWRPIGATGNYDARLTLGPSTTTALAGRQVSETATLLDGSGTGLPDVAVNFTVVSGPDAGRTGTAVTSSSGQATFTYAGAGEGEDVVSASVTTVGSFASNDARVMWTDDSPAAWSSGDIGGATPPGTQSLDGPSGTWTVQGGGTGAGGSADQFHYMWQTLTAGGGAGARVASQTGQGSGAQAGVMLRASTAAGSPYYAALVAPGGGVTVQDRASPGAATATVTTQPGSTPAYLWVGYSGSTFTAYSSADGYDWVPIPGSTTTLPGLPASLLAGLAVASGGTTSLNSAAFTSVVVSAGPPAPQPLQSCPAPWTCADIGSPALAGSQSFDPNNGTWSITAGGADVTGTSDQFRYVWGTMSGDGTVSAHMASQDNTSSSAKAGIMLRASTDPGAPNYAVFVTPGTGIKVQVRSAQGGTTSKIANPSGTVPQNLMVTRSGNTLSAYTSPDGLTWTLIPGSTATVSLPSSVLAGLAVTSHSQAQAGTTTINSVVAPLSSSPSPSPTSPSPSPTSPSPSPTSPSPSPTSPSPSPSPSACPAPWTCADIGSPALAGSQSFDSGTGTWTITAGGVDVTGISDQFRFVWQTMSGDGSVIANVLTQANTSSSAKAGIMLRASSDPAAPNYAVLVTPGTGIKVQVRKTQGGNTTKIANPAGTVPQYLMVTRSGNTFSAYTSPDGVTWTLIPGSTFTLSLPSSVLAGLAVTSHNATQAGTVTIDDVSVN